MNPMPSSEHLLFLCSQMFHIMHIGAVLQIFSYSQPTVLANLRVDPVHWHDHCTPNRHKITDQTCQENSRWSNKWIGRLYSLFHTRNTSCTLQSLSSEENLVLSMHFLKPPIQHKHNFCWCFSLLSLKFPSRWNSCWTIAATLFHCNN